ncbi:MAG: hypothetical protein AAFN13_13905 [Bacteroidota bacterium]
MALLSEAVTRIREFEDRLAAAHEHENFDRFEVGKKGVYGYRGILPDGTTHYRFHGSGCTVTLRDGVLDYDYARFAAPPGRSPLQLSPWKLYRTLMSLDRGDPDYRPPRGVEHVSVEWLNRLAGKGIATKMYEDYWCFSLDESALVMAAKRLGEG